MRKKFFEGKKRIVLITIVLTSIFLSGCRGTDESEANTESINETITEKQTDENDFLAKIQKDFPFAGGNVDEGVLPEGINGEKIEISDDMHSYILKDTPINNKYMLPVRSVLQNPELPTGCEVTSLSIVLNYLGYDADKETLAHNYLTKGKAGTVNAWQAFIGEPASKSGYGCYSTVLKQCAERYLTEHNSPYMAYNVTGSDFLTLLHEVESGSPVIIWATINMVAPNYTEEWYIDGDMYSWLANEHCVVLTGFDMTQGICYVSDPLKGNVIYPYDLVKQRYEQMFSQAIVIK